jgi:hypothetical protein
MLGQRWAHGLENLEHELQVLPNPFHARHRAKREQLGLCAGRPHDFRVETFELRAFDLPDCNELDELLEVLELRTERAKRLVGLRFRPIVVEQRALLISARFLPQIGR